MKKIFFALLLLPVIASAQRLQYVNTYGHQYQRVVVDSLFAPPSDTFTVPTALQGYPFIARKGTGLYLWNTSTHVWAAVSGGGGSSTRFGYSTEDFSAAENRNFNLHDTYNFTYDSANTFTINRAGNLRFRVNSTLSGIYSPNSNTYVAVANSGQIILRGTTNETNQNVLLGQSSAVAGLVGYNTITSPLVLSGGALSCPTCFTGSITPAALTKTDDTNVTLTLGGTPTTALLQATSITAGWTGTLGISRGGTGAATTSQNFAFIGPTSGSGAPSFRALVAGDIPSLSSTYLPLAGGTMVGNILATDNTYDLGASGATRFRTAYLATSLVAPLHIGGSATNQKLILQSTSGSGSGDSVIIKGGNNGATTYGSFQASGLNIADGLAYKIGNTSLLSYSTGSNNATIGGAYNYIFNNGGNVFMNGATTTYFNTGTGDLYLSGSGSKIGIGTASPAASSLLDVSSTTKGVLIPRMTTAQRNAISSPAVGLMIYNTTDSVFNCYRASGWTAIGGSSQWTTTGSDIYYNTGNVGIGNPSPNVALDVVGQINVQAGSNNNNIVSSGVTTIGDPGGSVYIEVTGSSSSSLISYLANEHFFQNGTVTINDLSGTGTRAVLADASGVLSAPVSDRTTKTNISELNTGISTLMKLKPVFFEYKKEFQNYGKGTQVGFIAQDIQKVLPNSVYTNNSNGKMGYNEIDIVPVLVAAMQEQQKLIEQLQKEVKKLKRK